MKLEVVSRRCIHRFMDGTLQTSYKSWGKNRSRREKVQRKIYSELLVYFHKKDPGFSFLSRRYTVFVLYFGIGV